MEVKSMNVPRVIVTVILIGIVCAAFYGLANGTILQHRQEDIAGSDACNGMCSECAIPESGAANGAINSTANGVANGTTDGATNGANNGADKNTAGSATNAVTNGIANDKAGSAVNGVNNNSTNSMADGATVIQMNQPSCSECESEAGSCYNVE